MPPPPPAPHTCAGGTYFRDITSSVTGLVYRDMWRCVPSDWLAGLSKGQYASPRYDASVNAYGAKCGQSLDAWESSGWITAWDPYGWFHWYCRSVGGGGGGVDDGVSATAAMWCAGSTRDDGVPTMSGRSAGEWAAFSVLRHVRMADRGRAARQALTLWGGGGGPAPPPRPAPPPPPPPPAPPPPPPPAPPRPAPPPHRA
jgi:hypothetical protein